jgi:hypothetical protein
MYPKELGVEQKENFIIKVLISNEICKLAQSEQKEYKSSRDKKRPGFIDD